MPRLLGIHAAKWRTACLYNVRTGDYDDDMRERDDFFDPNHELSGVLHVWLVELYPAF
jgi:hypothetical protein